MKSIVSFRLRRIARFSFEADEGMCPCINAWYWMAWTKEVEESACPAVVERGNGHCCHGLGYWERRRIRKALFIFLNNYLLFQLYVILGVCGISISIFVNTVK
jgi:hypothetical protein